MWAPYIFFKPCFHNCFRTGTVPQPALSSVVTVYSLMSGPSDDSWAGKLASGSKTKQVVSEYSDLVPLDCTDLFFVHISESCMVFSCVNIRFIIHATIL